jgi:hypothetical protein
LPYYRLYFIGPQDGHIRRFAELEAPDDAVASHLAREHEGEMALELWSLGRKILRLEATDGELKNKAIPSQTYSAEAALSSL